MNTLHEWLRHCEQLHPTVIDMGLERVGQVAQRLPLNLGRAQGCPVITVAGTNGKGSTCAMLEAILLQAGYRTGVYTSPHLVHFEERCRIVGEVSKEAQWVEALTQVEAARQGVSLSYFEFTTLAALLIFSQAQLDVVILEVGLGGRLDAVNVIDADCAVITSIDIDHAALLGDTREAIGHEKAGILRAGCSAIIADPAPPASVIEHAAVIGADAWLMGRDFNFSADQRQWSWAGRGRRYSGLAYPALRGANQLLNACGVLAALQALRDLLPVTAQAVRNGLAMVQLPGRFQIVAGQPTLVLDVAHNPHAVATLAANLDAMAYHPRTHAVFGAMADKDVPTMLQRIWPLIDHWFLCDLPTARAATAQQLEDLRVQAQLDWNEGDANKARSTLRHTSESSLHASPQAALQAALERADPADRIVVFGSFYTVAGVLEQGLPRLAAPHLSA